MLTYILVGDELILKEVKQAKDKEEKKMKRLKDKEEKKMKRLKDKEEKEAKRIKDKEVKQPERNKKLIAKSKFLSIKRLSGTRGIDFNLNNVEFMNWWLSEEDNCYYCNITVNGFKELKKNIISYKGDNYEILKFKKLFKSVINFGITNLTIDRKDNSRGYEIDNIVKACFFCNYIKGDLLTCEDMKLIASNIIGRVKIEIIKEDT